SLTVGGFYAHFASKEVLVSETIHETMRERLARFYQRPDDGGWADRLASMVEDYLSPPHRDNPLQGCPLPAIVGDTTLSEGEQEALATQLEAMVQAFRTGRHDARPHAPQDAALGSIALMVGGLILARAL